MQWVRLKSFFDSDITSLGVLPSIAEALHKYELFHYFKNWHNSSTFPIYSSWKKIVWDKICDFERYAWDSFSESHPNMRVVQSCLENVSPFRFWSLANQLSRFSQSNACSGEAHGQFWAILLRLLWAILLRLLWAILLRLLWWKDVLCPIASFTLLYNSLHEMTSQ